jgi:hypothetical protein
MLHNTSYSSKNSFKGLLTQYSYIFVAIFGIMQHIHTSTTQIETKIKLLGIHEYINSK